METLANLLFELAPCVHYFSFFLLILAGFNLPISEDIVFIISSSIAATLAPENTYSIFFACFLGAYIGDIIAYLIGKFAGSKILQVKCFRNIIPLAKIEKMRSYFQKYGAKIVFIGRFVPFGVRNITFISAGIGNMHPIKFLIIDFLALTITSTILLSLGYHFGKNYQIVFSYLNKFKILFLVFFLLMLGIILFKKIKSRRRNEQSAL